MTNYERICADKAFCASVISSALHGGEYEGDEFDRAVMEWLDKEQVELTEDDSNERSRA